MIKHELMMGKYRECLQHARQNINEFGDLGPSITEYIQWLLTYNVPGEFAKALAIAKDVYERGSQVPPDVLCKDIIVYMTVRRQQQLGHYGSKEYQVSESLQRDIEILMSTLTDKTKTYDRGLSAKVIKTEEPTETNKPTEPQADSSHLDRLMQSKVAPTFMETLMDRRKHRLMLPETGMYRQLKKQTLIKEPEREVSLVERNEVGAFPEITEYANVIGETFFFSPSIPMSGIYIKSIDNPSNTPDDTLNKILWVGGDSLDIRLWRLSELFKNKESLPDHLYNNLQSFIEYTTEVGNDILTTKMGVFLAMDSLIDDYDSLIRAIKSKRTADITGPEAFQICLNGIYRNPLANNSEIADIISSTEEIMEMGISVVEPYLTAPITAQEAGLSNVQDRTLLAGVYHKNIHTSLCTLLNREEVMPYRHGPIRLQVSDATYRIYPMTTQYDAIIDKRITYVIRRIR